MESVSSHEHMNKINATWTTMSLTLAIKQLFHKIKLRHIFFFMYVALIHIYHCFYCFSYLLFIVFWELVAVFLGELHFILCLTLGL